MVFRFQTDASAIHVHYVLRKDKLGMPHMPATGVSGVDLYAPIVLVEDRRFTNDWITPAKHQFHTDNHAALGQ